MTTNETIQRKRKQVFELLEAKEKEAAGRLRFFFDNVRSIIQNDPLVMTREQWDQMKGGWAKIAKEQREHLLASLNEELDDARDDLKTLIDLVDAEMLVNSGSALSLDEELPENHRFWEAAAADAHNHVESLLLVKEPVGEKCDHCGKMICYCCPECGKNIAEHAASCSHAEGDDDG